mmetsp:Transcript_27458/g.45035  ORF Transcript_27458/g.45035 Transcript_27458/m.45035 type:complete len:109 (-) Transcript_27458:12-338(-)
MLIVLFFVVLTINHRYSCQGGIDIYRRSNPLHRGPAKSCSNERILSRLLLSPLKSWSTDSFAAPSEEDHNALEVVVVVVTTAVIGLDSNAKEYATAAKAREHFRLDEA